MQVCDTLSDLSDVRGNCPQLSRLDSDTKEMSNATYLGGFAWLDGRDPGDLRGMISRTSGGECVEDAEIARISKLLKEARDRGRFVRGTTCTDFFAALWPH